mmetsp:Transcript_13358/g.17647  ORF Transcript_13358/g.17647 Transcript_13358/m.17647 type:complete len:384 (-) Transcript_13358:278-1429(-)|eukprot:CAMPEP_0185791176 /NCGR_PEP_ID=MMETSP1174-20130828/158223_1 /TAXON_ID=35687 /ORGANISM="Dictyocha speculum, Strain CCMP1381" /LENGTH=383 /DNA_ID=CAMNT_0028486087 /DNA_START=1197 /DNA_END=2348 /DNA_ORIENTATION=-
MEGADATAALATGLSPDPLQLAKMQALVAAQTAGGLALPGVPNMAALGAMGMIDSSTKTHRELFVGNTPPNTQEMVIMEFLNAALHQVNLNTAPGNPIIQCRVSNKFAFIELRSVEETNNTLSLNGIPFMGNMLKVGRPTKYQGPQIPHSSWQLLTGQANASPMLDPSTKVYRELFIGNTSPEMNEVDLQEFLGAAMQQVGLTTQPGNPILTTRLSGKQFAFIELRSIEETNNALNMNGIPYMGMSLRVGRPSKYNGPPVPHLDWNDLLVKYMSGELKPQASAAAPTKVVCLINMVTDEMLTDEADYKEILEDTREECNSFGPVESISIPRNGLPGTGKVFVKYHDAESSTKASEALAGRTFDGRRVEVEYFPEEKYDGQDFS